MSRKDTFEIVTIIIAIFATFTVFGLGPCLLGVIHGEKQGLKLGYDLMVSESIDNPRKFEQRQAIMIAERNMEKYTNGDK